MKKLFFILTFFIFTIIGVLVYHYTAIVEKSNKENVVIVVYDEITYEISDFRLLRLTDIVKVKESNGFLSQIAYKNGKRDGVKKIFYKDGKIHLIAVFKNNLLNGTLIGWNENGQKLIQIQYLNDKENGEMREWYSNSRLKTRGYYSHGVKNGKFTKWDIEGKIIDEAYYINGRKR